MVDVDTDLNIAIKGDVSDINSKLDQAGQKAKQMGDKAGAAGSKAKAGMEQAKAGADKAKIGFGVAAVAVQGFTSQIAGMGQQVLDFESKVVALNKTIVGLESQELALKRMQEDLNRAVAEGTIEERDYHRALEDIELQFKNVQLETQNVEAETKKLSGEYISFGINAVGAVAQIAIAFVAMGVTAGGVLKGTIVGVKALSGALWTVAKHPVFLIITAGILAWELGLKSIVENLTGIEDLGIFSNLQKAFDGLTQGESSMQELNRQTKEFGDTVEKNTPVWGSMAESIDEVGDSAERTSKKVKGLTIAQEQLMRSGGFRAGGGTSLSEAISREADEIDAATARTLAAASLHEALKVSGITGSLFGRNISGNLTTTLDSMRSAGRVRNSFYNSSRIFGTSTGGVSLSGGGFGGLTRSSQRRRSGRDRNPNGRLDKLSVRLDRLLKKQNKRLNEQFGFDIFSFTDTRRNRSQSPRFGSNSGLNSQEMKNIITERFNNTLARQEVEATGKFNKFRSVTAGLGIDEALSFLDLGFGGDQRLTFNASDKFVNEIQDTIQARNFFRGKGVDFDGMSKNGVSGLLNIREFGYREMNDQLAFLGQEQYQTVGT